MRFRVAVSCVVAVLIVAAATALTSWADTPSPSTRPASSQPLVDNPQYASWAKLKPGSSLTFMTETNAMGQQIKTQMVQKLADVTPEQAVVEVMTTVQGMPGAPAMAPQKVSIKAKVPPDQADRKRLPEGIKGESKDLPDETVEVNGKSYTCKVSEFSGVIQGINAKGKIWRTDEVPGQIVKSQMTTEGAMASTSTTTLSAIDAK